MKSDPWIIAAIVLAILLYLAAWLNGYFTTKRFLLISLTNLITGLSIIIYWAFRQWQIEQHIVEGREVALLIFELAVTGFAIYSLFYHCWSSSLKKVQAIFFGIHLAVLILLLIFMLTFKMNRLF